MSIRTTNIIGILTAAVLVMIVAALILTAGCAGLWPIETADSSRGGGTATARETASGPPPPVEKIVETLDATAAALLSLLGPLGAGAGFLWARLKPARTIRNLVQSVQAGRAYLKGQAEAYKDGDDDARDPVADFDETVAAVQTTATAALVRAVKLKANIRSVTEASPPPAAPKATRKRKRAPG